jgi:hypothetical protein
VGILDLMKDLRRKIETKHETLDSELTTLLQILTPTQTAKFLVWINNNPACMALLNVLWDQTAQKL